VLGKSALALSAAVVLLAGPAEARSPRLPPWASTGLIVYKCADSLCLIRPDGSGRRPLLSTKLPWPQWDPAISPRGGAIAFRAYYAPPADGAYALYASRTSTCRAKRLTHGIAGDPSWSPGGRWIVFDTSGYGDIDKIRPDGSGLTRLFVGRGADEGWGPAWSPDGKEVAFVRERRGGGQLWLMRADGGGARLLHRDPGASDQRPVWSHDGRDLAFVRTTGSGPGTIEVMDADGARVRALKTPQPAWNPVWLPRDTGIAFLSGRGGTGHLYVVRTDGRDLRQVTDLDTVQFTWGARTPLQRRCP
jgi:TolB protein